MKDLSHFSDVNKMPLICNLCRFETIHINDLCTHLHKSHLLYDSLKLNLKCCAGCPATFKTFNGFKKHLKKCLANQNTSENYSDVGNNSFGSDSNDNNSAEAVQPADNTHCDDDLIMRKKVIGFISKLYSFGLPDTTITSTLELTSDLIFPLLDDIVLSSTLEQRLNLADNFKYAFENQLTKYKRNKIFSETIVQPIKKAHGVRLDQRYDKKNQRYKTVPVTSTFVYIPLLDTLRMVLNNKSVQKYFSNDIERNTAAYTNFVDGDTFNTNVFFQENSNAIQVQLYYDEFEVCNPLGSKRGIHKIGAFYFTLNNFPVYINSCLENIHVLALCYNVDIKEFGINPVLEVIVQDIKKLESDGIFVEGMNSHFTGTLSALSFDNLGGAFLLGMNQSFQANFHCRICTMNKIEARTACKADDSLLRTSERVNQYVNQQQYANSSTLLSFGVTHKSALFDINYFDLCDNQTVDVMHDFLEGICPREMKLFFEFCLKSQMFDHSDLNRRVQAFDYGLHNRVNFPSAITLDKNFNSVGQRAAQTHCLLIHLPLILEDSILLLGDDAYNKWKVILLLIEILKIVVAPEIRGSMFCKLEQLIKEHHELLIKEYSVNLTAKHHLTTHYPMIIRKMGPPRGYWTMRYESKNGYLKDLSRKLKNYNDVAYTIAMRNQKSMLSLWENDRDLFDNTPILKNFKIESVASTNYEAIITTCLEIAEDTIIYVGKSVELRGASLTLNKFLCTSIIDDLPRFGKVLLFFSNNSEVYVICEMFETKSISSSCLGYILEKTEDIVILKISALPHTKSRNHYESLGDCVIITEYFL